jgi:hypothetical protein
MTLPCRALVAQYLRADGREDQAHPNDVVIVVVLASAGFGLLGSLRNIRVVTPVRAVRCAPGQPVLDSEGVEGLGIHRR